jgi:Na+(H+)/acetate symporter ActP
MTTRSLFNIILKILGIFFIKDILATIPQLLSITLYFKEPDVSGAVWTLITTMLVLLVYGLVSYFLIFKSELIIDKLKLDKGFDQETIPLNIHRSTILSISIIVIGGLIVADEIPNLCRQLFAYFQEKRMTYGQTNPSISYSVLAAAKIVIGLLLIGNQRQIVNFIENKRKK